MAIQARRGALLLLFLASTPALAQQLAVPTFTPNPAPQGANVRMEFLIANGLCFDGVATTVTRTGTQVRVDYVITASPFALCGVPPPVASFAFDLGGFPPGQYTVTATGSTAIVPAGVIPVVTGTFGVVATSSVPAFTSYAAAALAMLASLAGALALRRRTLRVGSARVTSRTK